MGEAMTTLTDDELELLRLCERIEAAPHTRVHKTHAVIVARALKSRLTSQSRDAVIEECAQVAEITKALADGRKRGSLTMETICNAVAAGIRALKSTTK